MIYAGMVQYKMPRETYSLLINLESLIIDGSSSLLPQRTLNSRVLSIGCIE